jgi:hypothetical protein
MRKCYWTAWRYLNRAESKALGSETKMAGHEAPKSAFKRDIPRISRLSVSDPGPTQYTITSVSSPKQYFLSPVTRPANVEMGKHPHDRLPPLYTSEPAMQSALDIFKPPPRPNALPTSHPIRQNSQEFLKPWRPNPSHTSPRTHSQPL